MPLSIRTVDPGAVFLACSSVSGQIEIELPLAPTVEWTLPPECGTGSGSIETSVDDATGFFHLGGSGSIGPEGYGSVSVERKLRIEIDVPDYGESTTSLVIVPEGAMFEATPAGPPHFWEACARIFLSPVQSEKLGRGGDSDGLFTFESVGSDRAEPTFVRMSQFVAGDTVTGYVRVGHLAYFSCDPAGACSVTWPQQSSDFQILAIAPDPQNPPQKQCSDGQDNDSDGKIDLADPQCRDAQDDTESNK